jgi:hypothetical protein
MSLGFGHGRSRIRSANSGKRAPQGSLIRQSCRREQLAERLSEPPTEAQRL